MSSNTTKAAIRNIEFLRAMFKGMPRDQAAALAGFHGDPLVNPYAPQPDFRWRMIPWQSGDTYPNAMRVFGGGQLNTYVCISGFHYDTSADAWKRRKDQFAQLYGVMIDDVGTKVPRRKLRLKLSACIETSPGNCQGFLFIKRTRASTERETCERLIDGMVRSGLTADGTDPGMRGVTRYGRLPVGINGKGKYVKKLGRPFDVRLRQWHPERRYTVAEIADAYRIDLTNQRNSPTPRPSGSRPAPRSAGALPAGEASRRVAEFEGMLGTLADAGLYQSARGDWHDITCPWVDEHTDRKPGGSALREPAAENDWLGGYKCWHGHCEHRTVGDVYRFAFDLRHGGAR